jgi:hypothetical protein
MKRKKEVKKEQIESKTRSTFFKDGQWGVENIFYYVEKNLRSSDQKEIY